MIAPDVEIVDLDPEGFARLSRMATGRVYGSGRELHVLHEAGEVVTVVDTSAGVVTDRYRRRPLGEPDAIRREAEVDRVVLVDRSRLDGLPEDLLQAARTSPTQPELFWRSQAAFWAHPAVRTSPAPPVPVWPAVHERLRAMGETWGVLGAWEGDELVISVVARFRDGNADLIRGTDLRPARDRARELLEAAGGEVGIALLCDVSDLERAFVSGDPAELLSRALVQRGLEVLLEPGGGAL